ncbi:hypothetical protein MMS46_28100, partial [Escherichia coli]|nr:hypothetical protein [Escherichia coli]
EGWAILLRQKQKKLIMLPSETMIWQPEFTDKTLSRKPGAVQLYKIGNGWKSSNTSTIESSPANRDTFLHTKCRAFLNNFLAVLCK